MTLPVRKYAEAATFFARHPGQAKYIRRRASTVGKNLMDARVPWLPFALQDELVAILPRGAKVFEYGGGGSTTWLLEHGYEVHTVEHDKQWYDELTKRIDSPRWTGEYQSPDAGFASYISAIDRFTDGSFDLVVVDGRERVECFLHAMSKVAPGGYLLLDDTDRDRYRPALEAASSWPRRDFFGLSPGKLHGTSALWRKPTS